MDSSVMFRLGYGLYMVSAKEGKDNGCIINTVMQITEEPRQIMIGVNKSNLTHDMIRRTGKVCVSVLDTDAPFSLYQHFGYQSGRDSDKFAEYKDVKRAENGLYYLTEGTNSYLAGEVRQTIDCGTHSIFLVEVTEGEKTGEKASVTYQYYQDHVKPKPETEQKGYLCKVCGYIYTGEVLPEGYICPVCKHGTEVFVKR